VDLALSPDPLEHLCRRVRAERYPRECTARRRSDGSQGNGSEKCWRPGQDLCSREGIEKQIPSSDRRRSRGRKPNERVVEPVYSIETFESISSNLVSAFLGSFDSSRIRKQYQPTFDDDARSSCPSPLSTRRFSSRIRFLLGPQHLCRQPYSSSSPPRTIERHFSSRTSSVATSTVQFGVSPFENNESSDRSIYSNSSLDDLFCLICSDYLDEICTASVSTSPEFKNPSSAFVVLERNQSRLARRNSRLQLCAFIDDQFDLSVTSFYRYAS
jgi:hypothetical protein